jgi:hypothetical protein
VTLPRRSFQALLALAASSTMGSPVHAARAADAPYQTGLVRWRAADGGFDDWRRTGVGLAADGTLHLDLASAPPGADPYPPGGYQGRNYYNGGGFLVGEAVSPATAARAGFREAIASWNADTPPGTWIEVQIRAGGAASDQGPIDGRWTKWFNLGVWAADASAVARHSAGRQADRDGVVAVDTLRLNPSAAPAQAFQLKLRLFSAAGDATPTVHCAAVATSGPPPAAPAPVPGDPEVWGRVLDLPQCSQMVYPDGGEVWCSPTSTAMVLRYWEHAAGAGSAHGGGSCEPAVRAAVGGVYDWVYRGHGNWPFNTAYAATHGLEAYVVRLAGLAQAEAWIAAGVPLVVSYGWGRGELAGAPMPSSNGHLTVLAGFDATGDPVVYDPAAPRDEAVRRTYPRAQLERLWLAHSGGAAYLIYPPGWAIPSL